MWRDALDLARATLVWLCLMGGIMLAGAALL